MNSWIELDKHPEIMNSLIEIEGDCLLLFDNGDVCKFSDKEHPFAIVTHFKSLTADDEQKRKAAPVMYEALRLALAADPCPAKDYWQTVETEHTRGECWHAKAEAALRAADGGE